MITWNNDTFVPPAPYTGSIPQVYDDPDYAVSPTSPYGTNCSTAMLVNGNPTNPPIFCQFEFDIETAFIPGKKVDNAVTARTKQYNDVVIAFPPANVGNLTITDVPLATPVVAGNPIGYTITVSNSAGGAVTGATLNDILPAGTNVNWTISPAYAGPGTCAITGTVGSQVLSCSFGTIAASQTFTIGLRSASSSAGIYTDGATTTIGNQQILSIASITVQAPLAITTTSLPSGTVGVAYTTTTLNATGGTTPYTWTVTGLPAGLTATTAGVISGTPTASGTFTVNAKVTDSSTPQQSATATLTLTVSTSSPQLTPVASNPVSISGSSASGYTVVVTLLNSGNVTLDQVTLQKATLSGVGAVSFPAGTTFSHVAPGATLTVSATFAGSTGTDGKAVPLSISGTYTAGTTTGNWAASFRSVTLP
jgi:uncharacterized repeat protein (TIGR01451 family)